MSTKTNAQELINYENEIENIVEQLHLNLKRTPGIAMALIDKDSVHTFLMGNINLPVQEKSQSLNKYYEIAQISDIIHSIISYEILIDSLNLGDIKINAFVNNKNCNCSYYNEITINDLFNHTTSLSLDLGKIIEENSNLFNKKNICLSKICNLLLHNKQQFHKKTYQYNFIDLFITMAIAAQISETNYKKLIIDFLEKNNISGIKYALDIHSEVLADGYDFNETVQNNPSNSNFDYQNGLKATLNGLTSLVQLIIKKHKNTRYFNNKFEIWDTNIYSSNGWSVKYFKKFPYPLAMHVGASNKHRIFIAVVPQTNTGIVLISNSKYPLKGLGFEIIKMLNNNFKKKSKNK